MEIPASSLDANSQKTPLVITLPRVAAARAQDAVQSLGKGLPCTVLSVVNPWVVTVAPAVANAPWPLQPLMVPVAAPPYIAYPIQVGDAGELINIGVRLGQLTGVGGGGTPNLTDRPANLAGCSFLWLGNASWTTLDPEAVVIWNNLLVGQSALGFFGTAKATKQAVTGALSAVEDSNAKAVLTSLIDALATYGLITNGTT